MLATDIRTSVKKTAMSVANSVRDKLEHTKDNYDEGAVKEALASTLKTFYMAMDASGMPEANIKACAIREGAALAANWLASPTPEGRRNILALGMRDFFYQLGGDGAEPKGEAAAAVASAKASEEIENKLKVKAKLTPAQKKAKLNELKTAKKKKEEDDDDDEEDDDQE